MGKLIRTLFTLLVGVMGLLLALSGVGLIQLSARLNLYSGIILLVVAAISYFLRGGKSASKKHDIEEENSNI